MDPGSEPETRGRSHPCASTSGIGPTPPPNGTHTSQVINAWFFLCPLTTTFTMAIKLSANYSKKLGLPKFSSHSFSVSVEVELTDLSQVEAECQRLYQLLQQSVDQEIQNTGFIPGSSNDTQSPRNGHPQQNGYHINGSSVPKNGNTAHPQPQANGVRWNCTEGQRGFILRIINEHQMNKQDVEDLSQQLFGIGVTQLNRMQASQLIEDLLVKAGQPARQTRWQKPQTRQAA